MKEQLIKLVDRIVENALKPTCETLDQTYAAVASVVRTSTQNNQE